MWRTLPSVLGLASTGVERQMAEALFGWLEHSRLFFLHASFEASKAVVWGRSECSDRYPRCLTKSLDVTSVVPKC